MRKASDIRKLREQAAARGYTLVKGRGDVPGKQDYGRYGLQDVKTGRRVMGFGKRGVTAWPEEVERFLEGEGAAGWDASLRSAKKGRQGAKRA